MFFNSFKYLFVVLFLIIFCFGGLVFALNSTDNLLISNEILANSDFTLLDSGFLWPTPGYTSITSPFGYRVAPTGGAGTYHGGIDIGVPTGTEIISSFSGEVTYIGFLGANGYSVQISNGTYFATYSHVSPYFLVYVGQFINKGDVIAAVGPKNVYGVPNNPYKDSKGNPTNRCYYWSASSFLNKKRRQSRQSFRFLLNYISSSSSHSSQ